MEVKKDTETRESFIENMSRFFESGAIQELYYNDYISILNYADMVYVVTNYAKVNENYMGFIFDKAALRYLASNGKGFYWYIRQISKSILKDQCIVFDDGTYAKAVAIHNKTLRDGPSEFIDKNLDAELLEKKKKEYGGMEK